MNQLKWIPKDPDKNIGVPGKGFIKASDFSQEDLDNLIARAKNRKQDVSSFLINAGLKKVNPQAELELDTREFEKEEEIAGQEVEAHEQPKRTRRTKAEIEASKEKE
jgi:hypothetical protein